MHCLFLKCICIYKIYLSICTLKTFDIVKAIGWVILHEWITFPTNRCWGNVQFHHVASLLPPSVPTKNVHKIYPIGVLLQSGVSIGHNFHQKAVNQESMCQWIKCGPFFLRFKHWQLILVINLLRSKNHAIRYLYWSWSRIR